MQSVSLLNRDSRPYVLNDMGGLWTWVEPILLLGVGLTLASLPLAWIELGGLGGKLLRPMHLAVSLIFVVVLVPRAWRVKLGVGRADIVVMLLCYVAFLLLSACSMLPRGNHAGGVNQLAKALIYFGSFVVVARAVTFLLVHAEERFCRATFFGCLAGATIFLALATYVFASQGKNLLVEYLAAIRSGNVNDLFRGFYPQLFNFGSSGRWDLRPGDAEYVATHLRHTIMGAFILCFVLLRAVTPVVAAGGRRIVWKYVSAALQGIAVFIVVTSVSRSSILAMVTVIGLGVCLSRPTLQFLTVRPSTLIGLTVMLCVAAAASVTYLGGMSAVLQDRFGNIADNPRLEMYEYAMAEIAERPLLGHGFAKRMDYNKSLRVHNFLLAAWYEGGLLSFLAASLFLGSLLWVWGSSILSVWRREPWNLAIHPAWILTLPVWPLLRSMVAGDGGLFAFVDWICLAKFVAALVANRVRTKLQHRQGNREALR